MKDLKKKAEELRVMFYGKNDSRAYEQDEIELMVMFLKEREDRESESTYVTFEQAKLLKQKRFNFAKVILFEPYYNHKGELNGDVTEHVTAIFNKDEKEKIKYSPISAPEQKTVMEYLWTYKDMWIYSHPTVDDDGELRWVSKVHSLYYGDLTIYTDNEQHSSYYPSQQEAYSAAIDYILKNLI
jgi:hypothetical protein